MRWLRGLALRLLRKAVAETYLLLDAFADGWLHGIDGMRNQWRMAA